MRQEGLKNIFLQVEYLGKSYYGFQIQNKKAVKEVTVQEVLEKALEKLFLQDIRIVYSSRTDRGVHAMAQSLNFKVKTKIPLANIKKALNAFLPADIKIKKIKKVPLDFHSRFSVRSKIYRYVVFNRRQPSVFWEDFSWHIPQGLDLEAMRKVSLSLIGKKDFSLFARGASNYKNCVRSLKAIEIKKRNGLVYIDIEADGFLRSMARNIVAFLAKIGSGEVPLVEAVNILKKNTSYINNPAPAQGLYLYKVKYL
ncbi:MAG: tRNA pseudouridine(38-40) synthase TruA [Candidatus Omnitrophica bacterium]|nr:tRNA pseudouridine(38-40) synthase TruA [Candidatus Omnitrophota bacterium]MDD5429401.1 tRNA pseudouridine(38-40) synthase TruA [Candidatus Omnitrophota bacterium]